MQRLSGCWRRGALGMALLAGVLAAGCQGATRAQRDYAQREGALRLIDEGRAAEAKGQPLLALEKYNRAATVYSNPAGFFQLGRIFEGQQKPREAAAAYQEALRLAPDYQEARFALLALGHQPEGETPDAAQVTAAREWAAAHAAEIPMSAATTDTQTSDPANLAELRAGVLEAAAAERQPTQAEVRTVLFSASPSVAIPSATDPAFPSDMDVILGSYAYHLRKAQQLGRRQVFEQAASEYERAIQADPKQIEARLELGDMLMNAGREQRALFHYTKAQQDFPKSPQPELKLGNYYLKLQRPAEARQAFRRAIEKDPAYVEGWNNLAVLAMREKQWAEAKTLLDEILKLQPDYANAFLNRGIIASDIDKNPAAALADFRRYLELQGPRAVQVQRWIRELEAAAR